MLTETSLSDKITNDEPFECQKNFNVYRLDRTDRLGGGILISVSDALASFDVPVPSSSLEFLCTCVHLNSKDTLFCVCYRPPNAPPTFCDNLFDLLRHVVKGTRMLQYFYWVTSIFLQSCGMTRDQLYFMALLNAQSLSTGAPLLTSPSWLKNKRALLRHQLIYSTCLPTLRWLLT